MVREAYGNRFYHLKKENWDEVQKLAEEYHRTGDQSISDELVTSSLHFMELKARELVYGRYDRTRRTFTGKPIPLWGFNVSLKGIPVEPDDLLQEGALYVYEKLPDYNPSRGVFVSWMIHTAIKGMYNSAAKNGSIGITLDRFRKSKPFFSDKGNKQDFLRKISGVEVKGKPMGTLTAALIYASLTGDYQELSELHGNYGDSDGSSEESLSAEVSNLVHFDTNHIRSSPFYDAQKAGEPQTEGIAYEDIRSFTLNASIPDGYGAFFLNERIEIIDMLIGQLKPIERKALQLRFGLNENEEHTLEGAGRVMGGMTKQGVQQAEARAIEKLKDPVRRRILETLL